MRFNFRMRPNNMSDDLGSQGQPTHIATRRLLRTPKSIRARDLTFEGGGMCIAGNTPDTSWTRSSAMGARLPHVANNSPLFIAAAFVIGILKARLYFALITTPL